MSSNLLLILLYLFNLIKNLTDYKTVFNLDANKDKETNCAVQTTYIIKFFILSLFHILILYLLSKNADFEAKPLILISYGLAIPIYTIEYLNKFYLKSTNYLDMSMFLLQCSASTLAIFLIWSKQSITSAITLIALTSSIMILPLLFLKIYNYKCVDIEKDYPNEEVSSKENKCLKKGKEDTGINDELTGGKQNYC
tara:strand:- start:131 stop:718 length:588 start_codon:yes stop_codon:yes gene_type:complete